MNEFGFITKSTLYFIVLAIFFSCENNEEIIPSNANARMEYQTENVFIIVIDGPRFSDTWGREETNIPYQHKLRSAGSFYNNFYNNGLTKTVSGHVAISTGNYEVLDNTGLQSPSNSSVFDLYTKQKEIRKEKVWIVTSKGKLEVLAISNLPESIISNNCGLNGDGLGSRNRHDSVTLRVAKNTIDEHQPKLMLIHFKEPDEAGHTGDWNKYVDNIKKTDKNVYDLIDFIYANQIYDPDNTSIIITNDHGRHLFGVRDGFKSHGDSCLGCRRISLLMIGPDFKTNVSIDQTGEQIDIMPTICEILDLECNTKGRILEEAFIRNPKLLINMPILE